MSKKDMKDGISSHPASETTKKALEMIESIPAEDDDLILKGGSAVIKPNHFFQTEPVYDVAGIIYADLDLNETTDGHLLLDTDGHYSRPDVFTLQVDTREKQNVKFGS